MSCTVRPVSRLTCSVADGAAGACGSQQKIEECNALVAVINQGVEKVQKGTTAPPDGGAAPAAVGV